MQDLAAPGLPGQPGAKAATPLRIGPMLELVYKGKTAHIIKRVTGLEKQELTVF